MINFLRNIKRMHRSVMKFLYTRKAKLTVGGYAGIIRVNFKSNFTRQTFLGNNVNFNGMDIKGSGNVYIGDNFHSGQQCLMINEIHNYDSGIAIPYDDTYIAKEIIIKDNVWLGDRVIILGGVTIEEGAIIQAGSVVVNNIPKYAIAGGNPAKVFKYRNVEHYEKLKMQGRFN